MGLMFSHHFILFQGKYEQAKAWPSHVRCKTTRHVTLKEKTNLIGYREANY